MTKPYSYDSACESLAEYFLGTELDQEDVKELAEHVQSAVEDWLYAKEREDKDLAVVEEMVAKQSRRCRGCGSSNCKYESGMGERLTCFDCGHVGPPQSEELPQVSDEDRPLTGEELALIDAAWETHKAAKPA